MFSQLRRRQLVALLALAACAPAFSQDPRASEAQYVAREWFKLTDAGDAQAAWQAAGKKFQAAMTPEQWSQALAAQRSPFGALIQRTLNATDFRSNFPNQPPGEYALLQFRTTFANRSVVIESISLERESDGRWRVVGYALR
ncbi:MAG: DUF4019 domain-containing protein [Casimicrobiaceae bacterium]